MEMLFCIFCMAEYRSSPCLERLESTGMNHFCPRKAMAKFSIAKSSQEEEDVHGACGSLGMVEVQNALYHFEINRKPIYDLILAFEGRKSSFFEKVTKK